MGGYAAAGINFRITDEDTYYMTLISSKGYFRVDAVKNSSPKTLIAWTEVSDFDENNINLKIIAYDAYLIFIINNKWIAEICDDSIGYGSVGFTTVSYGDAADTEEEQNETSDDYICKAMLDQIIIDTRLKVIDNCFNKWTDEMNINAEYRLRLAETFAVMNEYSGALDQIKKAWKRRDAAIRVVAIDLEIVRTRKELLLASRMAFRLGLYAEAEEYVNSILDQWPDSPEGKSAFTEKLKILYESEKYAELKDFALKNSKKIKNDVDCVTMTAQSHWQLKEYIESAEMWAKAFKLNSENGVYAANAANAYEFAANENEAVKYYITAGKIFLNQDNTPELAALVPKLSLHGENNWEARSLAGKWAFSIEDYDKALHDFDAAERMRRVIKPKPNPDPAVYYLWGLIYYIRKKNKTAVRLIEKAAALAPDYDLFREKLEEIKKQCK